MNKNIVLITSAIHTNYGIYYFRDRILQTIETVKSVKQYIPNPIIILIDNSKIEIQNEQSTEFSELLELVDYYIDNSDDLDIQYFHNNVSNYDVGKNVMEAVGLYKSLNYIYNNAELLAEFNNASRIFKLSGRYKITENFDITKFDNDLTVNKYVFKKAQPAWINSVDTGVDTLLQTRLWSFTPEMLLETIQMYGRIIENMIAMVNQGKYIDSEHSMSKFIPKEKLIELETIGVTGNIAPNGATVTD